MDILYNDWVLDMRMGVKEGKIYSKMSEARMQLFHIEVFRVLPDGILQYSWQIKKISNITQYFSAWGGVYGSILVLFTILYMLTILLMEKKDKEIYKGLSDTDALTGLF